MNYNYSKLLGRLTERYGTQARFCEALGISQRSLSLKLNNKTPFKQKEITRAQELLDIRGDEIQQYFFNLDVQSN
ncbi:DUF739 domain-containing protein [Veillonellaceae bacterium M2-8]|nr:DUF739 domain-containing protein [Veillonellaceae bacterium M2-8]